MIEAAYGASRGSTTPTSRPDPDAQRPDGPHQPGMGDAPRARPPRGGRSRAHANGRRCRTRHGRRGPGARRVTRACARRRPTTGRPGVVIRACRRAAAGGVRRRGSSPAWQDPGDADVPCSPAVRVAELDLRSLDRTGIGYDPGTMGSARATVRPGRRRATRRAACSRSGATTGWTLGEIARSDLEYLEWLDRMPIGRTYQAEIDGLLRSHRRRATAPTAQDGAARPVPPPLIATLRPRRAAPRPPARTWARTTRAGTARSPS